MTGYLDRPEATAARARDGWLDTGDLGFVLDGELFLTGRDKDILIVNGANHAPEELERAVEAAPGARPGCAVAVALPAGEDGTEEVVLLVEAARDASAGGPRGAARARAPTRCWRRPACGPSQVDVLAPGTLPRTSSGKLRRQEALRRFLDGALGHPRRVTPGAARRRDGALLAGLRCAPGSASERRRRCLSVDLVIVGGGPAGLAVAIRAPPGRAVGRPSSTAAGRRSTTPAARA